MSTRIAANCPACSAAFTVEPGEMARGKVRCPTCGKVLKYTVVAPQKNSGLPTVIQAAPTPPFPEPAAVFSPEIPFATPMNEAPRHQQPMPYPTQTQSQSSRTIVHVNVGQRFGPSGGAAAILEFLFAFFLQVFGIGHMYAGNILLGLLLLFGWWAFLVVNGVLLLVSSGAWLIIAAWLVPLCWLAGIVFSPILAALSCQ